MVPTVGERFNGTAAWRGGITTHCNGPAGRTVLGFDVRPGARPTVECCSVCVMRNHGLRRRRSSKVGTMIPASAAVAGSGTTVNCCVAVEPARSPLGSVKLIVVYPSVDDQV